MHSIKYEAILILYDSNMRIGNPKMQSYCDVKTDLMLIYDCMFQSICVIETMLSDFHLVVRARITNYRSLKYFSKETFRISLEKNLSNEACVNNEKRLSYKFCKTVKIIKIISCIISK